MEAEFKIEDKVNIIAVETSGYIDAVILEKGKGYQFRIIYWLDGTRRSTWMYPEELDKVKE